MTDYLNLYVTLGVTTLFTVIGVAAIIVLVCGAYVIIKSTFFD